MNTSEVLDLAADEIEREGWWDGRDTCGRHCAATAISKAGSDAWSPAHWALLAYLDLGEGSAWDDPSEIFDWNDSRESAAEVIETLRAAAAVERAREAAEERTGVSA